MKALVKYANVVSEERAAGRTGMGAVFGSKKLKGIIVKGYTLKLEVADAAFIGNLSRS